MGPQGPNPFRQNSSHYGVGEANLPFFGRALKGNVELLMRKLLMKTESCIFHLMCPTPSVLFSKYAYCRCRGLGHYRHFLT